MDQKVIHLRHKFEEPLKFELLLAEVAANFISLPAHRIDAAIEDAQRRICESIGAEVSALWQWTEALPRLMTLTHFHSLPGGLARPEAMSAAETFPWQLEKVMRGEIKAYTTEALPSEAAIDKETYRSFGIKSTVTLPLLREGVLPFGALSFNSLKTERTWPEEVVQHLTLASQIFSNALVRKQSEERYHLAVDSAEVGLWELDFTHRVFWGTDWAKTIFGYGLNEIISLEHFETVVVPEDRELLRQFIARAVEKRIPISAEYRIRTDDGKLKWILSKGRVYFKPGGEPDRLTGISIDISSRKAMEGELQGRLEEIEALRHQLETENLYLREDLKIERGFEEIVGESQALKTVLLGANQVAATDATVLLLGETGTGKGIIANAIHQMSARKHRPLVTVNCAALPLNLFESELFGREKGAFTSANNRQVGRFDVANGGTIFLDEIGEIPLELQPKLLRVLQEGVFERLGSPKPIQVDVRVIAATSRDLREEVRARRFREDLYYRLNVFPISIPPLRQRIEDIPLLTQHFTQKYGRKLGKPIESVSRATIKMLMQYDWPGNVRELEHIIERGVIKSRGRTLEIAEMLESEKPIDSNDIPRKEPLPRSKDMAATEREHILRVLRETGWKIEGPSGAASILQLHPSTLRFRIKKLGIRRPL